MNYSRWAESVSLPYILIIILGISIFGGGLWLDYTDKDNVNKHIDTDTAIAQCKSENKLFWGFRFGQVICVHNNLTLKDVMNR